MQRIRVSKRFTFDTAHALMNHNGPCRNIHGHTYHLTVTLRGYISNERGAGHDGMVMDFSDFNTIVKTHLIDKYDHALVLNAASNEALLMKQNAAEGKFIIHDFQPTCENMLLHFKTVLSGLFPPGVELFSLRLEETPSSHADWFATDNE
mgnify:FL=1